MILLFITALFLGLFSSPADAAEPPIASESHEKVVLKWLGNAGWEIRLGQTIILIDPFLTRKERSMDAEWKTDEEAVLKVVAVLQRGGRRQTSKREEVLKPWAGPIMGRDFVEGGTYLYYFSFGKQRVLHQSTANFIEEKLPGLQPDVVLLAEGEKGYNLENALKILQPKVVIIQHFDEWRAPFSQGIPPANMKRAQRFDREVRAVDRQIKTIIPQFLMTHALEP